MNETCFDCGKPAQVDHHVIPRSKGGTSTVPLCYKCHELVHDHHSANIRKLTKDALAKRKAAGIRLGRKPGTKMPKKLDKKEYNERLVELLKIGCSCRHISKVLGVTHTTVSIYIKNNEKMKSYQKEGKEFLRRQTEKPFKPKKNKVNAYQESLKKLSKAKVLKDMRQGLTYKELCQKYGVINTHMRKFVNTEVLSDYKGI